MPPAHIPQQAPAQEAPRKKGAEGGGMSYPSQTVQKSDRELFEDACSIAEEASMDEERILATKSRLNGILRQHSKGIFKNFDFPDFEKTYKVSKLHLDLLCLKALLEPKENNFSSVIPMSSASQSDEQSTLEAQELYRDFIGVYSKNGDNFCKARDDAARNLYQVASTMLHRERTWLEGIMIYRDNFAYNEKDHLAVNVARGITYFWTSLGNVMDGKDTPLDAIRSVENIYIANTSFTLKTGDDYLAKAVSLSDRIDSNEVERIESVHESVIEDSQNAIDNAEGTVTRLKVAHGVGSVAASVAGTLGTGNSAGADALYALLSTGLSEYVSESIDNHYRPEDQKKSTGEMAGSIALKTGISVAFSYTLGRVLGPGKDAAAPLTAAGGRIADMTVTQGMKALKGHIGSALKDGFHPIQSLRRLPESTGSLLGTIGGKAVRRYKTAVEYFKNNGFWKGVGNGIWSELKFFGTSIGKAFKEPFHIIYTSGKNIFADPFGKLAAKKAAGESMFRYFAETAGKDAVKEPVTTGITKDVANTGFLSRIKSSMSEKYKQELTPNVEAVTETIERLGEDIAKEEQNLPTLRKNVETLANKSIEAIEKRNVAERARDSARENVETLANKSIEAIEKRNVAERARDNARKNAEKLAQISEDAVAKRNVAERARDTARENVDNLSKQVDNALTKAHNAEIDRIMAENNAKYYDMIGGSPAELEKAEKIRITAENNALDLADEANRAIIRKNEADIKNEIAEKNAERLAKEAKDAIAERIQAEESKRTTEENAEQLAIEAHNAVIARIQAGESKRTAEENAEQLAIEAHNAIIARIQAGESIKTTVNKIEQLTITKNNLISKVNNDAASYITARISGTSSALAADLTASEGQPESEKYLNNIIPYASGYIAPLGGVATTLLSDAVGLGWSYEQNGTPTWGDAAGFPASFLPGSYTYGPWVAPLTNEIIENVTEDDSEE